MSYSAPDFMDDVIAAAVANGCEMPAAVDEDGELVDDDPETASVRICEHLEHSVLFTEEEKTLIAFALGALGGTTARSTVASIMLKIGK